MYSNTLIKFDVPKTNKFDESISFLRLEHCLTRLKIALCSIQLCLLGLLDKRFLVGALPSKALRWPYALYNLI